MSYNIPIASITNYCANPGSEIGTLGWATFADAAATSPVDGTGGSPNSTLTQSTTSPLRGYSSFLWTKNSGASRQGEGFSYDFTINAMDKGQVLQISYSYLIASGTFVDNDMTVWVYDVTNATMTQVAPTNILNTSIVQNWQGIFQTATNSTSYRLIFYVPVTTNSANTVQFDNFYVGPQIKSYGPFVSDPIAWTPTGAWSSNTTYTGSYHRIGAFASGWVKVATSGAPTSATLTINLPFTIDTTNFNADTDSLDGSVTVYDTSAGTYYSGRLKYDTSTTLRATVYTVTGTRVDSWSSVTQAVPMTFASGDEIHVKFNDIPVSGWSSGQLLSSDADSRVVAARWYGATASLSGSDSAITYSTQDFNTTGASYSSGVYTVTTPGKYSVRAGLLIAGTYALNNISGLSIYKNASQKNQQLIYAGGAITAQATYAYDVLDCVAGDTITIKAFSNCTSPTVSASDARNFLSIDRVSGPSQIVASESVNARYTTAASQSIGNGTVDIVDFGTKDFDSHSAVTTGASWKFTAPVSGKFDVAVALHWGSTNWAAASYIRMFLYKNGSSVATLASNWFTDAENSIFPAISGSSLVSLVAGDYIDIRAQHGESAGRALINSATYVHVNIKRVGN